MKNLGKFIGIVICFSCKYVMALDLKVYTDPSSPGVNAGFQLILEVTKTANDNVESVKPPEFKGLEYLGKSNQTSEQISTVNGKLTRVSKSKLLFELIAKKEGQYTIVPFEVIGTSGKIYKSQAYNFKVGKKASGTSPGSNIIKPFGSGNSLFDSFFRRSVPNYDPKYDKLSEDKKSFIKADINKTKVYEGEQIKVSWWLYTIGTLRDINTLKYPGLSGFWKEDTEQRTRLNFDPVYVNEIQYNRALLSSSSLFPLKAGANTIDEYESKISVSLPGRFSYSRSKSSIVSSQPVKIEVMPLPEPLPKNFAYGVGAYSLQDSVPSLRVKQNEPFNFTLKFEGYGNAKVIEIEKLLDLPKSISVYDIEEKTQFFKNGTSYKLFNITLFPSEAGEFKLPEQVFSFFDPDLEEYYSLSIPEKTLVVIENTVKAGIISEDYQGSAEVKAEQEEVLQPIKTLSRQPFIVPHWVWFLINGLFFVGIIGLKAYEHFFKKEKKKTLKNIIEEKLAKIEGYKNKKNYRAFGSEANSAIELLIGKSTLEGSSSYEMAKLIKASSPRLQREYGEKLSVMRQKAELLAFAPEEQAKDLKTNEKIDSLYAEIKDLLLSSCKIIEGD